MKMSLFIGSARESEEVVEALKEKLEHLSISKGLHLEINPWYHGIFGEGDYSVDSLIEESHRSDFAVFVGDAIDVVSSRGSSSAALRDNVVFEWGLFMAILGRHRAFMLHEHTNKPRVPSDLFGLTLLPPYRRDVSRSLTAALATPAGHIISAVEKLGPRKALKPSPRVSVAMDQGSTRKIEILADCALYISDDADYRRPDAMKRAMLSQGRIPTKYLYYTHEGSQRWLDLCQQPSYAYFNDSLQNIAESATAIARTARSVANRGEFDFVSCGPGDGRKDCELIRKLAGQLALHERLFYYPIDVSETLLVTAVRTVMKASPARTDVKAVLADFTFLKPLNFIYEIRDGINFFSLHGNTIGNSSEQEMLSALDASMLPGDFLFLEVNVNQAMKATDPFFTNETQLTHSFSPLLSMDVKYDRRKISVWENPEGSVVPGAKTIITSYDAKDIAGAQSDSIAISEMHCYHLPQLAEYLRTTMGLEIHFEKIRQRSGLLLARRPL